MEEDGSLTAIKFYKLIYAKLKFNGLYLLGAANSFNRNYLYSC